jgi:hypothetical protein
LVANEARGFAADISDAGCTGCLGGKSSEPRREFLFVQKMPETLTGNL